MLRVAVCYLTLCRGMLRYVMFGGMSRVTFCVIFPLMRRRMLRVMLRAVLRDLLCDFMRHVTRNIM